MTKERLLSFTDCVVSIVITIMVLDIHMPRAPGWMDFLSVIPSLKSYTLSFLAIGIYWNNHHHMFAAVRHVNGRILWANLYLLFWLSLIPVMTSWIGITEFASLPVFMYGFVFWMAALAYYILEKQLLRLHDENAAIHKAIGKQSKRRKEKISILLYVAGMATAWLQPDAAMVIFLAVTLMWIVPDSRMERAVLD